MHVYINTTAHKFSKLLRCSTQALPVKRLKDVFSILVSPRATWAGLV